MKMNAGSPLVSVIIPTYNRPELLQRAVESVLSQSYDNVELVVVDDCPSNPARDAVTSISNDRVNYILHNKNEGVCGARNTGIEESSGRYLSFLDDDDEWAWNKLEKQISVIETNSEVGLVYTGTRSIDHSGNTLSVNNPSIGGDVTKRLLLGDFVPFSTILVDQNAVERAGLLDEYLTNWEDWEWCVRLSQNTDFGFVKQPLVTLHRGSHDMRSDNFERKRDIGFERFMKKIMPVAAEYGSLFERKVEGHINYRLGYSALSNGYYADSRKYMFTAIKKWPFISELYLYFCLGILGDRAYTTTRSIKRWIVDKLD